MPSQNNSGQQFDKVHAITLVAAVALLANRFVAYDGGYPSVAGGAKDSQGITESAAAANEAVTVVTSYSYLVEAGGAIAFGDYVKPMTDGTGRGVVGTLTDHCARALGAASTAGQLVEVQIVRHTHA